MADKANFKCKKMNILEIFIAHFAQFMEEMENAEIRRAKFFGKRTKVSRVLGRMLKSWSSNFDRLNRQLSELSWTEYHPGKLEELLQNAITFDKMLRKIVNKICTTKIEKSVIKKRCVLLRAVSIHK